jgi:uncharacterized protein YndB with AHSA1/START domain
MPETTITVDSVNLEIRANHAFKTTRDRLWQLYSTPAAIQQWWGVDGMTVAVDAYDFRPNGQWKITQTDQTGTTYAFQGGFREILPGDRIVSVSSNPQGIPTVETSVFRDWPNAMTRLTITIRFRTEQELEGALASGLEQGLTQCIQRLEALVERL